MAITSSAKKEIRASERKRVFNLRTIRKMRFLIKDSQKKSRSGDAGGAKEQYRLAQKAIDKACKNGIIKKRNASRKKMILAKRIKTQT